METAGEITTEAILKEVESAFPYVEMPPASELTFHEECDECEDLRRDLEDYRGKELTGEAIGWFHQELSLLSAKAWEWILPHYLRYCLSPEGQYNEAETQFLILNLGPDAEFEQDTEQRLSRLNAAQLICLLHFLEWCLTQEAWAEEYTGNIEDAKRFLLQIKKQRDSY